MNLELPQGAHLETADGDDLGKVKQYVVTPSSSELTHVLVEKGVFFPEDRVVPVATIDHVEDDRVILRKDIDPSALPRFVREDYTPVDDGTRGRLAGRQQADYIWRYPVTYAGPFPIYPAYPMPLTGASQRQVDHPATRDRLAESEIIGPRTPVISIEGDKVGTVSEMQIDGDGELSHLVVDLGFLSDEKVLPAHWIESIESEGIRLAVGNEALQTLETIT